MKKKKIYDRFKLAERKTKKPTEQPAVGLPRMGCGMANPVAEMPEEEAKRIAAELGEGKDMGSWRTMSGEQFMNWWRSSNQK